MDLISIYVTPIFLSYCAKNWENKWGFTREAYAEMNKTLKDGANAKRLRSDQAMFHKIELEDLPKNMPKTTSGQIGYLAHRKYPFPFR